MAEYQAAIDAWRARSGAPLVTAAVRVNGDMAWLGASAGQPARRRFCVYSITKTFTAVCVLRLAQAGLLDVDQPVERWRPLPAGLPAVSLRHLLRHTGGLPDYGGVRDYHEAVRARPSVPWTDEEYLAFAAARGPVFAPGEGWAYSNIGYMLLRNVVERVTGGSFRAAVHEHIAAPLGLDDTFVAERIVDWSTCVPGYGPELRMDGGMADVRSTYHPGWCAPGVAVSTVEDITRFYDALLHGDLLRPQQLAQMLSLVRVPGLHPPFVTPSYGMGLMADPDSPHGATYGHGGGGPGYGASASIFPQSSRGRVSVAVFCSSSTAGDVADCARALLHAMI